MVMNEDKIRKIIEEENKRLSELPKKFHQDKYCYKGTKVLKNQFHITDQQELMTLERKIVGANLTYIQLYPFVGDFDVQHLKDIHYILFGSIYEFAGKLRDTDLSKGGTNFCSCDLIQDYLDETLQKMNRKIYSVNNKEEYLAFLAYFYSELNMAHPFREGNGRTIREFMRQFVKEKNSIISFGNFELLYSRMDKDKLLEATIYSVKNDTSLLIDEFAKGLIEKENMPKNDFENKRRK